MVDDVGLPAGGGPLNLNYVPTIERPIAGGPTGIDRGKVRIQSRDVCQTWQRSFMLSDGMLEVRVARSSSLSDLTDARSGAGR